MKNLLLMMWLCGSLSAQAATIFKDFPSFYKSLPNRMFNDEGRAINISGQNILFDGKQIALAKATAFKNASVIEGDLGNNIFNRPRLFENPTHYCVEGQSTTANGTAVRHRSVYLIYRETLDVYKLSSLFFSCLGVGKDGQGNPTFLDGKFINYQSAYDADGVCFTPYTIKNKAFKEIDEKIALRFIDKENSYASIIAEDCKPMSEDISSLSNSLPDQV